MGTEHSPLYVLLDGGEISYESSSKEDALQEAHLAVMQKIGDFYLHDLPLKVTEEMRRDFDVEFHVLSATSRQELPLQEWVDSYYREMLEDKVRQDEREYQHYLALRDRFEGRRLQEELRSNSE